MHGIDDNKNIAVNKRKRGGDRNIKEKVPTQDHKGSELQKSY